MKQALSLGLVLATIVVAACDKPAPLEPPAEIDWDGDPMCAKYEDWIHDSYSDKDCRTLKMKRKFYERKGDAEGLQKVLDLAATPGGIVTDEEFWSLDP